MCISFPGVFSKTTKRYFIVGIFVEWANNRRIKKFPPVNYLVYLIHGQ